jgi:hypothetical protein
MKKIGFVVAVCFTLAASSFAGTTMSSSKEYKAPMEEVTCFGDHEFQVDLFGAYAVTEAHQGLIMRDHGWGGGVGLNYFLNRWIGIGVDGSVLDTKSERIERGDFHFGEFRSGEFRNRVEAHNHVAYGANGSIYLRYPIDRLCLAPYIYVGGGAQWGNAFGVGSAHAGGGLEYRIIPQRVGLFVDGRFTAMADKKDVPIHNPHFTMVRAGVRFAF